jgi:hypothetical protein
MLHSDMSGERCERCGVSFCAERRCARRGAGLRNLCEGNPVVQAQISELEVQKVLDSPEMKAKGVTVQMQPNGKPRFCRAADA